MADEPKPYRVYRGGRARPSTPLPRQERSRRDRGRDTRPPGAAPPVPPPERARPGRRRIWVWLLAALVLLLALVVAWAVASYLSVRSGVGTANGRLDRSVRAALTPASGSPLGHATDVLVLGTDHAPVAGREADQHSDSMMLVRF